MAPVSPVAKGGWWWAGKRVLGARGGWWAVKRVLGAESPPYCNTCTNIMTKAEK